MILTPLSSNEGGISGTGGLGMGGTGTCSVVGRPSDIRL